MSPARKYDEEICVLPVMRIQGVPVGVGRLLRRMSNRLGLLYSDQGKMKEAEDMYLRALTGKEKTWGPEHTSTLDTVNNLGLLYSDQGKMKEAEDMFQRAKTRKP